LINESSNSYKPCIELLNNKIKKLFKDTFEYDIKEAIISDKRKSKKYNETFENIIDNYDENKSNDENFNSLNKKEIPQCLEYINNKAKIYKEFIIQSNKTNIPMFVNIKNEETNILKIKTNLNEHLENSSTKNTLLNKIKKIRLR